MSDDDTEDPLPLKVPTNVAATRSYAPDSLAPFERLPVPQAVDEPPTTQPKVAWIGVALGLLLVLMVVAAAGAVFALGAMG